MINNNLSKFHSLGCFNDPFSNILNISSEDGIGKNKDLYSKESCQKEAIKNEAIIFGLEKTLDSDALGKCFLSDYNTNPLEQVEKALSTGLSNKKNCSNLDNIDKVHSLFINDRAFNFFTDVNLNNTIIDNTTKFREKLFSLTNNFNIIFKKLEESLYNNLNRYNQNNVNNIFKITEMFHIENISKELLEFDSLLKIKNKELDNIIKKLNLMLKLNDIQKNNTNYEYNNILNSDNGSIGRLEDTKNFSIFLFIEMFILIIISIIFIIFKFKK